MLELMILTIAVALLFDLVTGFHDAANSIATIVSTRVLTPGQAVIWAAFFNMAAMFVFLPRVADTISKIITIEPNEFMYMYVILSGLLGAIAWDLFTWWSGMPTSSSHALIGGVVGAGVAHAGWEVIAWDKLRGALIFIVVAPVLGFILGFALRLSASWLLRLQRPVVVDSLFRKGQLLSAALYSLGFGANDAQKTMGIIIALMVAAGKFAPDTQLSFTNPATLWIILSCYLALAIGTALGGWSIVKTMGMRITRLQPIGGFCAETAGATTLFVSTLYGIPVSTTHIINGSIIGVGTCTNKFYSVRWAFAMRMIWSWIFTIPTTALVSAGIFRLLASLL
ncbi:MAG: inorganic phosphate transporter [Parachlamydia sp.]|nr:inorganic phosphate transporter [Parachlamydia sp.]